MLQLLRDQFATAALKARYQRLVHERLLELASESSAPQPVADEPGWHLVGGTKSPHSPEGRANLRERARRLTRENPHACNILRLLESYVTGPGLQLAHQTRDGDAGDPDRPLLQRADDAWKGFLNANGGHYSFREHARRTWRDGECFLRKFSSAAWPPALRFVDPELIVPAPDQPETQGIVTRDGDAEAPLEYLKASPERPERLERIPAEEMLHTRLGTDSNEKRGVSIFTPVLETLECYGKWMETELLARKLQSSIVLWRKVQGSPQTAEATADQSASSLLREPRRERFAPGTILTTNQATEIQFLQPNTNFGDAAPLGRMLLLGVAAGAGLPEFMLTADASNANFSSTMIAEGPAVKFFQSEQQFFAAEFTRLWRWVMQDAVDRSLLPEDFFERVEVRWTFPQLVARDRPRERLADVRLVEAGILSRAEVARRDGVDPRVMQSESRSEAAGERSANAERTSANG